MVLINGFCVNVIAVKTGPVKFDREHQSKGGGETKTIGGLKGPFYVFFRGFSFPVMCCMYIYIFVCMYMVCKG